MDLATGMFHSAVCLYGGGALCALRNASERLWRLFVGCAMILHATSTVLHFQAVFPLVPFSIRSFGAALCLAVVAFFSREPSRDRVLRRLFLWTTFSLSLLVALFPKDFYLPLIQSYTIWAHLFTIFGMGGRGLLWAGTIWLVRSLLTFYSPGRHRGLSQALHGAIGWIRWGFALWTVSMFSGVIWSYHGWGVVVVWDDVALLTTLATWFFVVSFLHLHLSTVWSHHARILYGAIGMSLLLGCDIASELGPFRWIVRLW